MRLRAADVCGGVLLCGPKVSGCLKKCCGLSWGSMFALEVFVTKPPAFSTLGCRLRRCKP